MAITDKGNSRDVCVAAIAAPPTITDMARESQDGIGIIDFLERRNFLVTGATGFLAKGNENKPLKMCVSWHNVMLILEMLLFEMMGIDVL